MIESFGDRVGNRKKRKKNPRIMQTGPIIVFICCLFYSFFKS